MVGPPNAHERRLGMVGCDSFPSLSLSLFCKLQFLRQLQLGDGASTGITIIDPRISTVFFSLHLLALTSFGHSLLWVGFLLLSLSIRRIASCPSSFWLFVRSEAHCFDTREEREREGGQRVIGFCFSSSPRSVNLRFTLVLYSSRRGTRVF